MASRRRTISACRRWACAAPPRWKPPSRKALAANGPTVIEAVVNSDHYVDTVYD